MIALLQMHGRGQLQRDVTDISNCLCWKHLEKARRPPFENSAQLAEPEKPTTVGNPYSRLTSTSRPRACSYGGGLIPGRRLSCRPL